MKLLIAALLTSAASAFAPPSSSVVYRQSAVLDVPTSNQKAYTLNNVASRSIYRPLFMGWGPDPIWSSGAVDSNIQACPSGSCISLKLNVDDGTGFMYPGQYVQVKPSGDTDIKPVFLAIASAPTGTPPKPTPPGKKKAKDEADEAAGPEPIAPVPATWEFLIKKTDNNDWLTNIQPGQSVDVSQVMGGGFPIQDNFEGFKYDFPTQNVLLFATGSGIAPIRSAIESKQLNISPSGSGGRTCTLYYGVKTPDDMPYVSKFAQWEELGVQVVPVISQPDLPCESGAVWQGRTGYVQNALEEDGVPIPRNSGALLCGVKGMCESVKSTLADSGMFEGRILFNF